MKPRLKVIAGRPVSDADPEENPIIQRARERFGRAFCYEPGSTFKPDPEPVLNRWRMGNPWKNTTEEQA